MSKPIETNTPGFKIRIHIHPSIIHAFSTTEPIVTKHPDTGRIKNIEMTQDPDSGYGDIIGFIDWSCVNSVTWKKAEEKKPPSKLGRPTKIDLVKVLDIIPAEKEIEKSILISLIQLEFNTSERTARESINTLIESRDVTITRETPREGGGTPMIWITRNPVAKELDAFFDDLRSKLD